MTNCEKNAIRRMRQRSSAYKEISEMLGLPEATIKTFCKRNHLQDTDLQTLEAAKEDFAISAVCVQCGKELVQNDKRKPKRFCSDDCRLFWWNSHRNEVAPKNTHKLVCSVCGKEFQSYSANRKYCCHACYISGRFGKART